MSELNKIEDTLFVPLLGRIYASENFPNILYDKYTLNIKDKLPNDIKGKDTQTQYTLMAGAVRSVNVDKYIQQFIADNDNAVIVEIGCGLETTFFRNDNGKTMWYGIDFENVINFRNSIFEINERQKLIKSDATSEDWLKVVMDENSNARILVVASGLLYYFKKDDVFKLCSNFKKYGNIDFVFDIVNSAGMKRIAKFMKQVGHPDAEMYFYVDDAQKLAQEVGCICLEERPYYKGIIKKGLKLSTKLTMTLSDKFKMVKMIHLSFMK